MASFIAINTLATDIFVKPGAYTIEKALQQAREERRLNGAENIRIKLAEGTYRLNQPIIVRPEDNGIKIMSEGRAIINGGIKISGWKKQGNYFVKE